jgi:hypothetical protein
MLEACVSRSSNEIRPDRTRTNEQRSGTNEQRSGTNEQRSGTNEQRSGTNEQRSGTNEQRVKNKTERAQDEHRTSTEKPTKIVLIPCVSIWRTNDSPETKERL